MMKLPLTTRQTAVWAATWALLLAFTACSSDQEAGTTTGSATGGVADAGGGAAGSTGGSATGGGSGSGGRGSGGTSGSGGIGTGGGSSGTGGTTSGTGGGDDASGGADDETGGAAQSGGSSDGGVGPGSGGEPSTGGEGSGGATPVDPNVSAAIDACMVQLPWGAPDLSAEERAPIIDAIVKSCAEFAPPGPQWQTYCQMFLVGAINAESSYQVTAGTVGAGDGADPSVGLLQIRFTSTVRDFVDYGPKDAMARVGCDMGTVTADDSFATKGDMMMEPHCNIAFGTWYYFIFGSGNGGSEAVWVWAYCAGEGVAGSLHIGMACHLMGAEAAHSSISGADYYYDEIKEWFDPCVTYSGTHPFELTIEPDMGKYCG